MTTEDNILKKNRRRKSEDNLSEDVKFEILSKSEDDSRSRSDPPEQSHKNTPSKLKMQKKFLENASKITPSKSQRIGGVGLVSKEEQKMQIFSTRKVQLLKKVFEGGFQNEVTLGLVKIKNKFTNHSVAGPSEFAAQPVQPIREDLSSRTKQPPHHLRTATCDWTKPPELEPTSESDDR